MSPSRVVFVGVEAPDASTPGVVVERSERLTDVGIAARRDVLIITTKSAYEAADEGTLIEYQPYKPFDQTPEDLVVLRQCKGIGQPSGG